MRYSGNACVLTLRHRLYARTRFFFQASSSRTILALAQAVISDMSAYLSSQGYLGFSHPTRPRTHLFYMCLSLCTLGRSDLSVASDLSQTPLAEFRWANVQRTLRPALTFCRHALRTTLPQQTD
jgi:hypothetical protein